MTWCADKRAVNTRFKYTFLKVNQLKGQAGTLTVAHRCRSEARRTSGTPQGNSIPVADLPFVVGFGQDCASAQPSGAVVGLRSHKDPPIAAVFPQVVDLICPACRAPVGEQAPYRPCADSFRLEVGPPGGQPLLLEHGHRRPRLRGHQADGRPGLPVIPAAGADNLDMHRPRGYLPAHPVHWPSVEFGHRGRALRGAGICGPGQGRPVPGPRNVVHCLSRVIAGIRDARRRPCLPRTQPPSPRVSRLRR